MWDATDHLFSLMPLATLADAGLWQTLFDFNELMGYGIDAVVYLVLAIIGTLLFAIRLVMTFFGFDGADADFDVDADFDGHGGFGLLSMLSITAFFMGAGWGGLAARIEWGLGSVAAAGSSIGIGVGMMLFASVLMFFAMRLASEKRYDTKTAVGRTGQTYMTVPEKGEGAGQVRVVISGRSMIVKAISTGPKIEAFTDVKVVEVRDDETLIVEPFA